MLTENTLSVINSFHTDLKVAIELVYDKCGFEFNKPKLNLESIEYGACSFELNKNKIIHRVSKITPTKAGQFVTIWKRKQDGITEPYSILDDFDFIIITARSGENFGQFIFPKAVLAEKGIITKKDKEGKRGIRVYPPWDKATNNQALKTQTWQTNYFLIIKNNNLTDLELAQKLFTTTS
ncbi:MAG: MepB family protein [Bacteroidota bacterium]|nr:MepB family protein [Bacteroidota bacterium]